LLRRRIAGIDPYGSLAREVTIVRVTVGAFELDGLRLPHDMIGRDLWDGYSESADHFHAGAPPELDFPAPVPARGRARSFRLEAPGLVVVEPFVVDDVHPGMEARVASRAGGTLVAHRESPDGMIAQARGVDLGRYVSVPALC
jgi:hypothetical protein